VPALIKEWQDLVLEYGFAYGKNGQALWGKTTFHAITTGGPQEAYGPQGYNHFTIRQLLAPLEQTANLCGMKFLAPLVVHRSLSLSTDAEVSPHARIYQAALEALMAGTLDLAAAAKAERLNDLFASDSKETV
jgi:putative NADPH-quinone reductase